MSIVFKIEAYLGRKPDFLTEVRLQNDGSGDYIKEWNITSEKAKPTDDQLNALSSQATALENTAKIDAKRQTEYLSWQEQFEMIYKDQKNGTSIYKDHCDKVRSDNPKE
tara:strand:+ start:72 stop:398 length:327 start_codon:yes stop_codon:yes gene_type:complete